jgi:restriction system protein
MDKAPIWIVRAGEGAAYAEEFVQDGLVAIGWIEPGPLEPTVTDEELERRFATAYAAEKEGYRRTAAGMVRRFLRELKVGDLVATYDRDRRVYPLGSIAGEPQWREHELARWRRVKWTHEVSRDVLSVSARNSLGSIATLFRLSADVASEMWTKATPIGSANVSPPTPSPPPPDEVESEKLVLREIEAKSQQFVEDRLARLDWRDMQQLVAGILRAMGYRTRVAADGPDRGVDIFASPDGLGLQEPRVFVEVKHRRNEQIGSPQLRSFLGGRKPGDRCLYVSTGGFSKEARYEAERSAVPLTLLTLADLRDLLIEHHDQLDAATRSLIPLRQIFWPAD